MRGDAVCKPDGSGDAKGSKPDTWVTSLLIVTALMSLLLCGICMYRHRKLALKLSLWSQMEFGEEVLRIGDLVPGFQAVDLNGQPVRVSFEASESLTLLLVVSPTCSGCDDDVLEWWPQLATDRRLKGINSVLVTMSDAESFRQKFPNDLLVGKVLASPSRAFRRAFRIYSIPKVILVSPEGKVLWLSLGGMHEGAFQKIIDAAPKSSQIWFDAVGIHGPRAALAGAHK